MRRAVNRQRRPRFGPLNTAMNAAILLATLFVTLAPGRGANIAALSLLLLVLIAAFSF